MIERVEREAMYDDIQKILEENNKRLLNEIESCLTMLMASVSDFAHLQHFSSNGC